MKTKNTNQNSPELKNRPEQLGNGAGQQKKNEAKTALDFKKRAANRLLPTEKVLELLRSSMPRQYEMAEVVGKWVWITFAEEPAAEIRAGLSQLGFHWNNARKCWQHPAGELPKQEQKDPRSKYGSRLASATA